MCHSLPTFIIPIFVSLKFNRLKSFLFFYFWVLNEMKNKKKQYSYLDISNLFVFFFFMLIRPIWTHIPNFEMIQQITWIDGLGNVLTTGIDYMKEPFPDSRRVTAKSILKLTPKKEHHNTTFTCQAQNTADRTYRSAKLKLEVSFSFIVVLSLSMGFVAEFLRANEKKIIVFAVYNGQ